MKVSKTKELCLLFLLIITTTYTYLNPPESFYIGGGSCYQGISATINMFILKVCFILSFIALILILFNAKIIISKILSSVSLYAWGMWAVLIFSDAKESELFYCMPFLAVVFLIMLLSFKYRKLREK